MITMKNKILQHFKKYPSTFIVFNIIIITLVIMFFDFQDTMIILSICFIGQGFLYGIELIILNYFTQEKPKSVEELIDQSWKEYHEEKNKTA